MIRLVAALAVLYFAALGALWALEIVSPATAQDLLVKGGALLAILAVAGAALGALAPRNKPEESQE